MAAAPSTTQLPLSLKIASQSVIFLSYDSLVPPGIGPGEAVTDFKISHDLPAGEHDISVGIATFDLNDFKKPLNGADIATAINVS